MFIYQLYTAITMLQSKSTVDIQVWYLGLYYVYLLVEYSNNNAQSKSTVNIQGWYLGLFNVYLPVDSHNNATV